MISIPNILAALGVILEMFEFKTAHFLYVMAIVEAVRELKA